MSRRLARRRLPVVAGALTATLTAGCLLEVAWPGALDALRTNSPGQWWRVLTAPFVQDSGVARAEFNVVSAAIIIALAEWQWGRLVAVGIWLTGAWAPIGDVLSAVGYHVSAADTTACTAGSSGATYFTAATLCVAMLWGGTGRTRLVGPAVAVVMWIATNEGHGVVFIEGFALGLLPWPALRERFRRERFRREVVLGLAIGQLQCAAAVGEEAEARQREVLVGGRGSVQRQVDGHATTLAVQLAHHVPPRVTAGT